MKFKWKLSNSEWNVRTVTVSHATQHGSIVSEQNSNNMQEIIKAKQNLNLPELNLNKKNTNHMQNRGVTAVLASLTKSLFSLSLYL